MKKIFLHIIFFVFSLFTINAQQLIYSNIVYGGVTGVGFSTGGGSGTVNSVVQIPSNCSIKKAFLIAATDSTPPPITVILNGNNYTFDSTYIVTNGFTSLILTTVTKSNSSIQVLDITNDIDSSILNYSMTIPPQPNGVYEFYSHFYLYIIFENPLLPRINCNLFLNTQNVAINTFYNLSGFNPLDNTKPVGLGLLTSHFCDTGFVLDGSYISVNGNTIGLLGGSDANSSLWSCTGTYANFAHYNDSLFGLDDDTPDSLMAATDALADIKSYVNNGDTTVDIAFYYQSFFSRLSNPIRAVMLSYSTPCDTFTTTISSNDTVCLGDSIQLNATGGSQYLWYCPLTPEGGIMGGLSDTAISNPMASPPQTTTYIVAITNDSGCVKTEQVKIWVNPVPVADTIIVTDNICGDTVGSITVGNIPNGTPPYNYQITNLQNTNITNQNTNLFDSLVAGNYQIQITDSNGCQWLDTVTVNEVNNVVANFTATPQSGVAPLDVTFNNTSLNANGFQWTITNANGDTVYWIPTCVGNVSNCEFSYTFDSSGTYQVCLVAFNNIQTCADTICKTIVVEDEISLIIPNVFTPNFDGDNDNFVIQLTGAALIKSLKAEIYNRWGMLIKDFKLEISNSTSNLQSPIYNLTIWDGYTTAAALAPQGTYFYVITYKTIDGEVKSEKGSVTLLR